MAKATFEQAPVKQTTQIPGFKQVMIPRSGDEIVDAGMVAHYESMGYQFSGKSETGSITMKVPIDVSDAREARAIQEHKDKEKSRVLGSGDARDLNNVQDIVERVNKPVSIEQLGSMMGASPGNIQTMGIDNDEL